MMRSLYAGVSGLRSHQTRMDVIGNNIANVNTVGFKSSRVTFKDVFYQTASTASTPSNTEPARGGTNPYQIGVGTMVATIDTLNTRAGYQTTDKPFDVYIDGEGYFKVRTADNMDGTPGMEYYTRVGNFTFDALGQLIDGYGNFIMGVNASDTGGDAQEDFEGLSEDTDETEPIRIFGDLDKEEVAIEWKKYTEINISSDGKILGIKAGEDDDEESTIVVLGQIALFKFANSDGLSQKGSTYLVPTTNSGDAVICTPGQDGTGALQTNGLEMSNVDLSKEFTDMIVTQRGFQANSRIITVSDEMLQELVNLKR